jgi:hypothetical protein
MPDNITQLPKRPISFLPVDEPIFGEPMARNMTLDELIHNSKPEEAAVNAELLARLKVTYLDNPEESIDELQIEVGNLEETIEDLKETNKGLVQEIAALEKQGLTFGAITDDLESQIQVFGNFMDSIKSRLDQL